MRLSRKSTQTTLFGEFVPTFPKVRTSRGYLLDWDRNRIVRQIVEAVSYTHLTLPTIYSV